MIVAGYLLPDLITSNYQLADKGSDQFASWVFLKGSKNSLIYIAVQHGEGTSVNLNTENSIASEIINIGQFQSVVSQQESGVVIGGIADNSNTDFILVTFEKIDFDICAAFESKLSRSNISPLSFYLEASVYIVDSSGIWLRNKS